MVSFTSVVAGAVVATVALAQAPNATFSTSDVQSILTDTSIGASELASWCTSQRTSCSSLCSGQANVPNTCDPSSLNFNCTCSSNNSAPALQYYQNTIPWYECTTLNGKCMATNANDLAAQEQCNVTYVCGDIDISKANIAPASSSAAASASATGSSTASSTASTTSSTAATKSSSAAVAALKIGEQYGLPILGAGLFAAMGLIF